MTHDDYVVEIQRLRDANIQLQADVAKARLDSANWERRYREETIGPDAITYDDDCFGLSPSLAVAYTSTPTEEGWDIRLECVRELCNYSPSDRSVGIDHPSWDICVDPEVHATLVNLDTGVEHALGWVNGSKADLTTHADPFRRGAVERVRALLPMVREYLGDGRQADGDLCKEWERHLDDCDGP